MRGLNVRGLWASEGRLEGKEGGGNRSMEDYRD